MLLKNAPRFNARYMKLKKTSLKFKNVNCNGFAVTKSKVQILIMTNELNKRSSNLLQYVIMTVIMTYRMESMSGAQHVKVILTKYSYFRKRQPES